MMTAPETRRELIDRLLNPVISLEEAAILLGVCKTTIRRWANAGKLKCTRTGGNQRRFHLSDVMELINK